ncbi:MAG: leucine-rich repeat protein [Ruminococcus sp.]
MIKKLGRAVVCALLAAVITVLSLAECLNAYAFEESVEEFLYNGNIYYRINECGEIVITRSRASVTEAVIPAEIDGMPVTEIKNSAFQERTRLTKVVLPETVTKIGDYAFHQCIRLEEVYIPETVSEIGWNILKGTPWLKNQPEGCVIAGKGIVIAYSGEVQQLVIPEGVSAIAGCAFENSDSLMSVSIPESVSVIGGLAFSGCSKLTECTIPDGVREIGAYAFNWCSALQKVYIADSVETIGSHTFLGCKALFDVKLPVNLKKIETSMFYGCISLTRLNLPASVTEIGSQAFMECISLGEILLRRNVAAIGEDAFSGCTGLQKIIINNTDCKIADSEKTIPMSAVIYGFMESSAYAYAQKYQRRFVPANAVKGDINDDGAVDISDATIIMMLYAKRAAGIISKVNAFDLAAGDMNGDLMIDAADATEVLAFYAENSAGIV